MTYVKYAKSSLVFVLAAVLAVGVFVWLRSESPPITPSPWIVDAAIALNRAPMAASAPGDASVPAGGHAAAMQLALEGQRLRIERRFAEAEAVYRKAVQADPMDADSWADLADCAAAAAGNDLSRSRDAIMRAIAIDPRHRKALWLRASLELQEQRYVEAAATWRELQSLVTAGTSDAKVIAANIAEAEALARDATVIDGRPG